MSILFADIYDGIRAIRVSKGVCERDILNYVEEKAGGCMKVGNVLKTIRTLQKLVDDGQLVKNGNRYSFPPKGRENEEDQEEEDEEEEEENEEELDMEPDECDQCDEDEEEEEGQQEEEEEGEEEEDEEKDEDEEEEDEDDDDDEGEDDEEDESCNETEGNENSESRCSKNNDENEKAPDTSPSSQGEPNCSESQKPSVDMKYSRNGICRNIESNTKDGRKLNKEKHILEEKDGANRGEKIAFCARDFIDSLAESKTDKNDEEEIEISKAAERVFRVPKRFSTPGKKCQPVPMRDVMARFRSRSPLRGRKRDFSLIGQEVSQNFSFTGAEKDALGDTIDNKMELDVVVDPKDISEPQKNPPKESSSLQDVNMEFQDDNNRVKVVITEPGILNKSGSSSLVENIPGKETLKLVELKSASHSNMIWYTLEDSDNVPDVLQGSISFESGNVIGKKYSMCSVCEKKKRIS